MQYLPLHPPVGSQAAKKSTTFRRANFKFMLSRCGSYRVRYFFEWIRIRSHPHAPRQTHGKIRTKQCLENAMIKDSMRLDKF
ncbi:MAG: hypothetical protein COB16_08240 [Rhodobacteraceae bacterium]|nr:MAG: hypothetical protein COB16_08240 [Paracoccaceae bacterium]